MTCAAATPASATTGDMNAAGQPDTPMEFLTDLLGKALHCNDPSEAQALVKQAHSIASGLDPYLDSISTPPSEVTLTAKADVQSAGSGICFELTMHMLITVLHERLIYKVCALAHAFSMVRTALTLWSFG